MATTDSNAISDRGEEKVMGKVVIKLHFREGERHYEGARMKGCGTENTTEEKWYWRVRSAVFVCIA